MQRLDNWSIQSLTAGPLSRRFASVRDALTLDTWTKLIFLAFAGVYVLVSALHVQWGDENQAWLIARQSASIGELLHYIRYESHPPVWHLMLYALKSVAPSLEAMRFVQGTVALAMLTLIFFASPFSLALKVLLAANYFIFFEYGVLARPYGLGALLALAIAASWQRPLAWVFIALMTQVSFHFIGLAGGLGLYRLATMKNEPRGIVVAGLVAASIGVAISMWFIWPHPDMISPMATTDTFINVSRPFLFAGVLLLPLTPYGGWFFMDIPGNMSLPAFIAAAAALPWLFKVFEDDVVSRWLSAALFVGTVGICYLLYPAMARHMGIVMLFTLAVAWIRQARGLLPSAWLVGMLSVHAVFGGYAAAVSSYHGFSPDNLSARWVRDNGLAAESWVVYPGSLTIDFSSITDRPVYNLEIGCRQTYQVWTYSVRSKRTQSRFVGLVEAAAKQQGGTVNLMTLYALPSELPDGWQVKTLHVTERGATGGPVYMYQVNVPPPAHKPDRLGPEIWPLCPR